MTGLETCSHWIFRQTQYRRRSFRISRSVRALRGSLKACSLSGDRAYNPGWNTWLDLHSLLLVSEAVAISALGREESRGAHTRIDFPETDPEQAKHNTLVTEEDGRMVAKNDPIPVVPDDLQTLIKEGV